MSKKNLLLNLMAISCLTTGGINAIEKPKLKSAEKGSTTKVETKGKDDFFIKYKTPILSAAGGLVLGGGIGGGVGYHYGQKGPNEDLSKANAKITELEQKLDKFSNAQSTIDSLNAQLEQEKQKNNTLSSQIIDKDNQISSLNAQISNLSTGDKDTKITDLSKEVEKLKLDKNNLTNEVNDLKAQVNKLTEENTKLKGNVSSKDIEDIIGEENAKNLAGKKEELKKIFKLGEILNKALGGKTRNVTINDCNFRFCVNWKGWHNLQSALKTEKFYYNFGDCNTKVADEVMPYGLGGINDNLTLVVDFVRNVLMDVVEKKKNYEYFTGFVNFAVNLVNEIKDKMPEESA